MPQLRRLWWHISFYKKTPWVWFATQKNSNNKKRHTNRHLQGRLCNLVLILTSDVATTTRFYTESRQLTNNNETPGSDIFCKAQFFCVGLFISKPQTVVPVLDTRASYYQVVGFLCWFPPLSVCLPSFGMFLCCCPPCCVHTASGPLTLCH